jgi:hypothetical protein
MDDQGENNRHHVQQVVREGIGVTIVAQVEWFLKSHKVDGVSGQEKESHLHQEQVHTSPNEQNVEISGNEYDEK